MGHGELDVSLLVRALAVGTPQDGRLRARLADGEALGRILADRMIAGSAIRAAVPVATENRHRIGLFPRAVWLGLLAEAGFEPRAVPFENSSYSDTGHEVFLGLRPGA